MAVDIETLIEQVRIAAGLDSLTTLQTEQVKRWINATLAMIAQRLGPVELLNQDNLTYVVSEVVSELLLRPQAGVTSRSVTVDDTRIDTRFGAQDSGIWISESLWDRLKPVTGRARGMSSIPLEFRSGYAGRL